MVPATGSTRLDIRIAYSVVSGLAKKGRFHEPNQYFTRSAHHAVRDPAAPLDAQAETRDCGVSITEDVPVLRIDHVPIKGELLGVWQALYSGGVTTNPELALLMGRLTAEDAIESLGNSRCSPELESVRVSA